MLVHNLTWVCMTWTPWQALPHNHWELPNMGKEVDTPKGVAAHIASLSTTPAPGHC